MSGLDQSSIAGACRCLPSQVTPSRSHPCTDGGSRRAIRRTTSAERPATWRIACNAADPRSARWSDKRFSAFPQLCNCSSAPVDLACAYLAAQGSE